MLLLIFVLLGVSASLQSERCTEAGIFSVGQGSEFQICSYDNNNETLSLKKGNCGSGSVFSVEAGTCVPLMERSMYRRGGQTCYNRGYTCADCKTLNFCWDRGNGYEVVASKQCSSDQQCSAYSNSCERNVIPQCRPDYKFTCNYMGIFPDPYKCQIYYFCQSAGSEPITVECPMGQYYDPLYSDCVPYRLNHKAPCPPTSQCTRDSTLKPLARNPNLYYLCIKTKDAPTEFTTSIFRCPENQLFDGYACSPSEHVLNRLSF